MRGLRKYPLLGSILTFAIVTALVIGPALAMNFSLDVHDVNKGNVEHMVMTAYIPNNERIPLSAAAFWVDGPNGEEILGCNWWGIGNTTLDDFGGMVSCSDVTLVTTISPATGYFTSGSMYGTDDGVGYNFGMGFGYGYGYMEGSGTYPVIVTFDIYWPVDEDLPLGTYSAQGGILGMGFPDNHAWYTDVETFSVSSATIGRVVGGGSSTPYAPPSVQVFDVSGNLIATGQFSLEGLGAGDSFTFAIDGEGHTGEVLVVGNGYVIIRFTSDPQDVRLEIGDTKQVDLDYDGTDDISVTLNGIIDGEADVTVIELSYIEPSGTEQPTTGTVGEESVVVPRPSEEPLSDYLIIAVIVVILFVITLGFIAKKPKKKK